MPGIVAALAASLHVLFVGDSISAGTGAIEGGGFVALIAKAQPEWTVHAAGCPGASSADWLRAGSASGIERCATEGAFASLAAPHIDADVVHILLGTNDAIGYLEEAPIASAEFVSNVAALARRFSGDVIVSLPPPAPRPHGGPQRRLDRYAKALRARAAAPDAPFRIGADFGDLERARLTGVHPDGTGHAWMARRLVRTLRRLSPPPGVAATAQSEASAR